MLPHRLIQELAELRADVRGANQGKLRGGLALILATVVLTATSGPPPDVVQGTFILLLGIVPAIALGIGLMVGELFRSRADRRARIRADDREVQALREAIAVETRARRTRATPTRAGGQAPPRPR